MFDKIIKKRPGYFIGIFAFAGLLAFGGTGLQLGGSGIFDKGYTVHAEFTDLGGLEAGDSVTVAGVKVGQVETVKLKGCSAVAVMRIDKGIDISDDAVASIKTKNILGRKYVQICPGGSEKLVGPGGVIRETESAIDPERLISNYIFGKV